MSKSSTHRQHCYVPAVDLYIGSGSCTFCTLEWGHKGWVAICTSAQLKCMCTYVHVRTYIIHTGSDAYSHQRFDGCNTPVMVRDSGCWCVLYKLSVTNKK